MNRLIEAVQRALRPVWDERLGALLSKGQHLEDTGVSVQDAYVQAYRDAYRDAMVDMYEAGLLTEPPVGVKPCLHVLEGARR
jgi:hypothetical protein